MSIPEKVESTAQPSFSKVVYIMEFQAVLTENFDYLVNKKAFLSSKHSL